ncbi:hypothetical protein VTN49DRAFT_2635 [Thermomyces lanuginosus]|uniref:uncharacterized protein n=1 Tax=Thermomyces lanuginosus TaxID=5541 RepID=UPI0037427B82
MPEAAQAEPPRSSVLRRKRTWRACDRCSTSRTRCDGACPCRRCLEYGYACHYDRPIKKRGRTRRVPHSPSAGGTDRAPARNHSDQDNANHEVRQESASPSAHSQQGDRSISALRGLSIPDLIDHGAPYPLRASLNNANRKTESQCSPSYFDPPVLHRPLDSSKSPANSAGPHRQAVNGEISNRFGYRCLEPLLPYLSDIMPEEIAYQLFDVFLVDPGTSLFRCASPYILTRVFRKKSLLHPTNPRRLSPALLAIILWCCAQEADIPSLCAPGSRLRVSNALYQLSLTLIAKRDRDMRRSDVADAGGQPPDPDVHRIPQPIQHEDQTELLDDVLTSILLCIVISGGDFKPDCMSWWDRAVRLAMSMGLNREDENRTPPPTSLEAIEHQEERRRVFWLLYCLDRHLGLSFNRVLQLPDSCCQVYAPLPEHIWERLDEFENALPPRVYGPPMVVTGTSFFEYFLPLMAILGDIIDLHHRRQHPRFGMLDDGPAVSVIEDMLAQCQDSLNFLAQEAAHKTSHEEATHTRIVLAYSTHILHVLHVLLHGKWDAISMLDNEDDWITTPDFSICASHAIAASEAVSTILELDPELTFMPYLFGIYLLHGSFILLLFADRMPQLGPNQSVELACEVIIRAHEVCVVTLSTEFQRNFRKVVRSTLYSVRGEDQEEHKLARRKILSLYRWTKGARGLAI